MTIGLFGVVPELLSIGKDTAVPVSEGKHLKREMTLKNKIQIRPGEVKSLLPQFDDLMHKSKVLQQSCLTEFKTFTINQEENRLKWLASEERNESLEEKVKRLESQAATLETQLKHARLQAEYELQRRKVAEKDYEDADRQMGVIRELLNDKNSKSIIHDNDRERLVAFTNSQRLSTQYDVSNPRKAKPKKKLNTIMERSAHSFLSDVSFDKTEEDLLDESKLRSGKTWKRPSAPPSELEVERHTPPKRHRDDNPGNDSIVTATITIDTAGKPSATLETSIPRLNKSFSEPTLDTKHRGDDDVDSEDDEAFGFKRNVNNHNINFNAKPRKSILKSTGATPETPMMRKAHSAGRGLNRVHVFISKTVIKPETCIPCGKRIRFSKFAMKCKDCRAVCHPECKDKLPLPCIPSCPSTPGGNKLTVGLISDYAPTERPMIPRLIVNCVNEIENRGLSEVGIYRVPGSDKDQKELKEKFLKGRYPNLTNYHDIHVICGCLKDFLRGLKEPLITYHYWSSFIATNDINSREQCTDELCSLVSQLPQANKDTLAFLLQHLHSVSKSPECKMPIGNLAKVFGPTVVGYSCPDPEPMKIMSETHKQNKVMEHLFDIPEDFWSEVLNMDDISLFPSYTPDSAQAPRSMLGPLRTPDMPERYSSDLSRIQNTPRFAVKTREPSKPSRFFSSPLVQ